jgi:hypothetical protein
MSTVRRTSAVYNAHLAYITALQPEHANQFRALSEGLTSATLADLRMKFDEDFSVFSIDDAQDLWGAIERNLPWEQVFSDATCSEFSHVASIVESLLPELDKEELDAELYAFHGDLSHAIETAQVEMAGVEQCATAQAIGLALKDLGYNVERADLKGVVTGFEASKVDSKLVVEVTAGGEVVTDFVGLSDTASCGSAQEALVEKVASYGVDLAEQDRHDHRDTRGGGLVQRVARAPGRSLAERIVSAHGAGTATRNLNQQVRTARVTRKAGA